MTISYLDFLAVYTVSKVLLKAPFRVSTSSYASPLATEISPRVAIGHPELCKRILVDIGVALSLCLCGPRRDVGSAHSAHYNCPDGLVR